jgi:outer membrane receptor for ferrienterochelin and colicin
MSGIVNIVTKEGAPEYHGSLAAYLGDYISGDTKLYRNIDDINPFHERNLQLNLEGPFPIFRDKLSFYASVRKTYTDGWLYGISYFDMYGDTLVKLMMCR